MLTFVIPNIIKRTSFSEYGKAFFTYIHYERNGVKNLHTEITVNILSFIGISAFAASGAMVGIKRKADLLGVLVLAATTATGGGVLRDILLGFTPPKIFLNPSYFFIAIAVGFTLFLAAYHHSDGYYEKADFIERANNIFDALGLGVFVSLGTQTAINSGYSHNMFLAVTIGTITGVGGGFLRDIMVLTVPLILRKHIYATAAISGSIVFYILHLFSAGYGISLIISTLVTFSLRMFATHFKWNLPTA